MNWLWFLHDLVHWLDDLRHFMAFTWSIWTWIGNISAGIVVAAVMSLLWPRMRHAFEGWFDRKIIGHLEGHHQRMAELFEGHMKELHAHIESATTPPQKESP
jgi:hypothetical protein